MKRVPVAKTIPLGDALRSLRMTDLFALLGKSCAPALRFLLRLRDRWPVAMNSATLASCQCRIAENRYANT